MPLILSSHLPNSKRTLMRQKTLRWIHREPRAAGTTASESGTDRAALLTLPGDRCVLPLYKLAVGNIVRGKAAIAGKLEAE